MLEDRIILFGSRAEGKGTEASDIDLVIVKETNKRLLDRRIELETLLADRAVPIDALVYTPERCGPFTLWGALSYKRSWKEEGWFI